MVARLTAACVLQLLFFLSILTSSSSPLSFFSAPSRASRSLCPTSQLALPRTRQSTPRPRNAASSLTATTPLNPAKVSSHRIAEPTQGAPASSLSSHFLFPAMSTPTMPSLLRSPSLLAYAVVALALLSNIASASPLPTQVDRRQVAANDRESSLLGTPPFFIPSNPTHPARAPPAQPP